MGTKNKLVDLNNHLFEQLERINDDSLTDEQLEKETKRSNAMAQLGAVIVNNSKLAFAAMKLKERNGEDEEIKKFIGL